MSQILYICENCHTLPCGCNIATVGRLAVQDQNGNFFVPNPPDPTKAKLLEARERISTLLADMTTSRSERDEWHSLALHRESERDKVREELAATNKENSLLTTRCAELEAKLTETQARLETFVNKELDCESTKERNKLLEQEVVNLSNFMLEISGLKELLAQEGVQRLHVERRIAKKDRALAVAKNILKLADEDGDKVTHAQVDATLKQIDEALWRT